MGDLRHKMQDMKRPYRIHILYFCKKIPLPKQGENMTLIEESTCRGLLVQLLHSLQSVVLGGGGSLGLCEQSLCAGRVGGSQTCVAVLGLDERGVVTGRSYNRCGRYACRYSRYLYY